MSEKELMYIEDALSHMDMINKIGCALLSEAKEINTTDMIDNILDKNKSMFDKMYNLIKE